MAVKILGQPLGVTFGLGDPDKQKKFLNTYGGKLTPEVIDLINGLHGDAKLKALLQFSGKVLAYAGAEGIANTVAVSNIPALAGLPAAVPGLGGFTAAAGGMMPLVGASLLAARLYGIGRKRRIELKDKGTRSALMLKAAYDILFFPGDLVALPLGHALAEGGKLWQGAGAIAERFIKWAKLDEKLEGFKSAFGNTIGNLVEFGHKVTRGLSFGADKAVASGAKAEAKLEGASSGGSNSVPAYAAAGGD